MWWTDKCSFPLSLPPSFLFSLPSVLSPSFLLPPHPPILRHKFIEHLICARCCSRHRGQISELNGWCSPGADIWPSQPPTVRLARYHHQPHFIDEKRNHKLRSLNDTQELWARTDRGRPSQPSPPPPHLPTFPTRTFAPRQGSEWPSPKVTTSGGAPAWRADGDDRLPHYSCQPLPSFSCK